MLHADVRLFSRVEVVIDGAPGEHIATVAAGRELTFVSLLRHVGTDQAQSPDPQVRLDRVRRVAPGRVIEQLTISSQLGVDVEVELSVRFATDLMSIELIKAGRPSNPRPFPAEADDAVEWGDAQLTARLDCPGATLARSTDEMGLTATWRVLVPAHGAATRVWGVQAQDPGAVVVVATAPPVTLATTSTDHRLRPWLERSLADLDALTMGTPDHPEDRFMAAGAPWYFTLFGRDSLWAARLLLPVDLGLAGGTLRTLARRQGKEVEPTTVEQPGKIMHELRRGAFTLGDMTLPPLYYGTIDATPLWICLLHDAWRAGLPDAEVVALLPHLERALTWLTDFGDADGDGFLDYLDHTGHGLVNQGWKDSADSVRFADGTAAAGPVALCEVQGYAYEAAVSGAALLEAFDRPGAATYRAWAADLATRFRASFWCGTGADRYPAPWTGTSDASTP